MNNIRHLTNDRRDSHVTEDLLRFITPKICELQSVAAIQRAFKTNYHPKNSKNIPNLKIFERVVKKRKKNTTAHTEYRLVGRICQWRCVHQPSFQRIRLVTCNKQAIIVRKTNTRTRIISGNMQGQ